jgi:hypothetical protein
MKKEALKRIQETLDQLETLKQPAAEPPTVVDRHPVSFQISPVASQIELPPPPKGDRLPQLPHLFPVSGVDPLSVAETELEQLPSSKIPARVARRYHVVKNMSKPIPLSPPLQEEMGGGDLLLRQAELTLEQVVQKIEALYYAGPIVDGWIDYYPAAPELGDEVEEIIFEHPDLSTAASSEPNASLSLTSYRVCGIDESGQQWSYPCPIDQLVELSMAIARYHKLKELLAQKRQLEAQFKSSAIAENIDKH